MNALGVIVALALSLSIAWYFTAASVVRAEMTSSLQSVLDQTAATIKGVTDGVDEISKSVTYSQSLRDIYLRDTGSYGMRQQLEDFQLIQRAVETARLNRNVLRIRLYFANGAIYERQRSTCFSIADARGEVWYGRIKEHNGGIWAAYTTDAGEGGRAVVARVRRLIDYSVVQEELGYVCVDIAEDTLSQFLQSVQAQIGRPVCLLDEGGRVLSSSGEEALGETPVLARDSLAITSPVSGLGWTLVTAISPAEIGQRSVKTLGALMAVSAVMLLVAVLFSFLLSRDVIGRIERIAAFVRQVDIHSDALAPVESGDEIAVLARSVNDMLTANRALLSEVVHKEKSKRAFELQALQAQINPHFLYNTLDHINWMAKRYGAEDISRMVKLLARFFYLSLNRGRSVVPLRDELEHVGVYVQIMQHRFKDAIEIEVAVEDALLDLAIMKLTLQPLVENAIKHGIQGQETLRGHIRITCALHGPQVEVAVSDDGAGMDGESARRVRRALSGASPSSGHALENIAHRTRLLFERDVSMFCESAAGAGTTIRIRFPAVPFRDEAQ